MNYLWKEADIVVVVVVVVVLLLAQERNLDWRICGKWILSVM